MDHDLTHKQLAHRVQQLEKTVGQQKKSIEKLRRNVQFYKDLIENSPAVMFLFRMAPDRSLAFEYISRKARGLAGVSNRDIINDASIILDLIHHDDRQQFNEKLLQSATALENFSMELRAIVENATIWISITGTPRRLEDGSVIWTGFFKDITGEKMARMALQESEENLRAVLNSIGDAVIVTDLEGRIVRMNPVAEKLTGWEIEDARNRPLTEVFKIINSGTGKEAENPVAKVIEKGRIMGLANDTKLIAKNGRTYQIADSASPVKGPGHKLRGVVLVFRDVTAEYLKARQIRETKDLLDAVFRSIQDGVSVLNPDLSIRYVNPVMERWYAARMPLVGRPCHLCYHNKSEPCDPCPTLRSLKTGCTDFEIVKGPPVGDHQVKWIELYTYPIKDQNSGKITGIVEFVRDITRRKEAEDKLRENEEKFRIIFQVSPDGITLSRLEDGTYIDVNESYTKIVGYSRDELIGHSAVALKLWKDKKTRDQFIAKLKKQNIIKSHEVKFRTKTGDIKHLLLSARVAEIQGQELLIATTRDITALKVAEKKIRENEEKFRMIFQTSPDPVTISRLDDGTYIAVNKSFTETVGYTPGEAIGRTSTALKLWKNPKERDKLIKIIGDKGYVRNYEAEFRSKDGKVIQGLMSARAAEIRGEKVLITISRDVTEHKRLQQRLIQAQKMESIGTLAGGIAHNFNNILMGIQGRASLMMMDKPGHHPDYEHLKAIEQYISSAVDLTKSLLGFARGGKYEVKPTDLNELVRHETKMFGRMKKEIKIYEKYADNLWTVEVDQNQIRQVLLNLFVNAWQAMQEGGELYIQSENITFDATYSKPFKITPGKYVKISVTDTGIGMDDQTLPKIFDPFYSTKETDQGSGLGLASVYGIVKNHGGFINVYSQKGRGATFNIYLPASDKKPVSEKSSPDRPEPSPGQGTIMLVDDEELIIQVGCKMLERLGYRVLVAQNGKQALEIYKRRRDQIDLVILDLVMPDMDGGRVFDSLKTLDPDVRVLLSSGYSINGQASKVIQRGCAGFIQKPFSIGDLAAKLRQIMD